MLEKQLENTIKKILTRHGISFFKVHGSSYQKAGFADLLIFNKFKTYALELKRDFAKNQPSTLQVATALNLKDNVVCLYADKNNYKFIISNIIKNKFDILKHYSNKQITYLKSKKIKD